MGSRLDLFPHSTYDDFDTPLSSQQVAMLKTVYKLMEAVLGGGSQEGYQEDGAYYDEIDGQRRNSLSLVINRGLTNMFGMNGVSSEFSFPGQRYSILSTTHFIFPRNRSLDSGMNSSWVTNMQKLSDHGIEKSENVPKTSIGNALTEAELSQELMETQVAA